MDQKKILTISSKTTKFTDNFQIRQISELLATMFLTNIDVLFFIETSIYDHNIFCKTDANLNNISKKL